MRRLGDPGAHDNTPIAWLGHRVREIGVHSQRLRQPTTNPRVVFFASMDAWEGSSRLRAFEMARALRERGWRATVVPKHLEVSQRRRVLTMERPDVLVFQKGRLPTHFPHFYEDVVRACGTRVVFDLDDADFVKDDQAVQCEALCKASDLVLAGSHFVARWCEQFARRVEIVWTGTPARGLPIPAHSSTRPPVIAWAQMDPMRYQLEGGIVRDALAGLGRAVTLRLYGVTDERAAREFFEPALGAGSEVQTRAYLPYDEFIESLRDVAIGMHVLSDKSEFARGKSFGKVLAYLAAGVPTIASDMHENPHFFRTCENGVLCGSVDEWSRAIVALLDDPALRDRIAGTAWRDFQKHLTLDAVSSRVDTLLRSLLSPTLTP